MKKKPLFPISVRRLVMIFCLPFVLLLCYACIYLYKTSQKELSMLVQKNAFSIMEQVEDTINEKLSLSETLPNVLTTSSYFYDIKKNIANNQPVISPEDYRDFSNSVYDFLLLHSAYFDSAFFYLDDYTILLYRSNSNKQLYRSRFNFKEYKDYFDIHSLIWTNIDSVDYPYTLYQAEFAKNGLIEVLGNETTDTHGVLFLEINDDLFLSSLTNSKVTPSSCITLVYNGKIQYTSSDLFGCDTLENLSSKEQETLRNKIETTDSMISYEHEGNYYIYYPLELNNMGILAVIPLKEMYLNYQNFSNAVIPFIVILVTICIILYFAITHIITKPILSLVRQLESVNTDFDQINYPDSGGTEIYLICDSINHFIVHIKTLMKNLELEMIAKQNAELQALYFQINPHFLYNALDCIHQLCSWGDVEKATTMVNQLATFYRIGVSKGNVIIPLSDEITHIQMYLSILKTRFEDFQYKIEISEECKQASVTKLILQPIVENAVYHGLRPYRTDGTVTITAKKEEKDLILTVTDNGGGIADNLLSSIQDSLLHTMDEKAPQIYGIKNVHDRIFLTYGAPYGLTINSTMDLGTTVTIRLPYQIIS